MIIYLLRHGETGIDERDQEPDTPLDGNGEQRVLKTVKSLLVKKDIQKIISSPFERAKQSAIIASTQLSVPILYDTRLTEIDIWIDDEDDTHEITQAKQVLVKKSGKLRDFLEEYYIADGGILIVAHGNVIRTVLQVLFGYSLTQLQDISIENASVTCITVSQEEGELFAKLGYVNRVG